MKPYLFIGLASVLPLAGCSLFGSTPDDPPPLGATYQMIDGGGTVVGKVVFTPLGQGQVFDAKGNLIGNITHP
jgi:hypothetical protein